VALTALASLLNHFSQDAVGKADYWTTFQCYLRNQRFRQLPPDSLLPMERVETRPPWLPF
jgi:hypothetical protein